MPVPGPDAGQAPRPGPCTTWYVLAQRAHPGKSLASLGPFRFGPRRKGGDASELVWFRGLGN